jgi:hypothetical protein
MEREQFFRWLPPFLNSRDREGLQVFLRTPHWYCNFNHTKEFGFLHRLLLLSDFGNVTAPGPFSFSVGSSFAQVRIDNQGKSSAIWSFPEAGLSVISSTNGGSLSFKLTRNDSIYEVSATFGADREFSCRVGKGALCSILQLSEEFISTTMHFKHGPVTAALSYVVDKDDWVTPPIDFFTQYWSRNITANLTLSYYDKWYQSSAVCWQNGHVFIGCCNHAPQFMPTGLQDLSFGTQFNFTRAVTIAFGCCQGNAMLLWRKQLFDHCHFQARGHFLREDDTLRSRFFLSLEYDGSETKIKKKDEPVEPLRNLILRNISQKLPRWLFELDIPKRIMQGWGSGRAQGNSPAWTGL